MTETEQAVSTASQRPRRKNGAESGLAHPADRARLAKAMQLAQAQEIATLTEQIDRLREQMADAARPLLERWQPWLHDTDRRISAENLACHIALQQYDLRELQQRLALAGLASPQHHETHVHAALEAIACALQRMAGNTPGECRSSDLHLAMQRGPATLAHNAAQLFKADKGAGHTTLMVTLPAACADDQALVREMLDAGMDCARIDCAHGAPAQWQRMVDNLFQARKETGRDCRLLFELGGPALHTGDMRAAAPILHIKIRRDEYGNTLHPTTIILDSSGQPGHPATPLQPARIAVAADWLHRLRPGDAISFRDLRRRKRELHVQARLSPTEVATSCTEGAWLIPGTLLEHVPAKKSHAGATTSSGAFTATPEYILLREHETLLLTRTQQPGRAEQRNARNEFLSPGQIPCAEPGALDNLRPGHEVWFDGGRIGGLTERIDDQGVWLRITRIRPEGERLGSRTSLHFPDSNLQLPALTTHDLAALDIAVPHADIIGLPFVQQAGDIDQVANEFVRRGAAHLPLIIRIATRTAIAALPDILVRGSAHGPFGVRIDRDSLRTETGHQHLTEIMEDMLWLCTAGHVPVIWTTQVEESPDGQRAPPCSEIATAATAGHVACVLLGDTASNRRRLAVLHDLRMQLLAQGKNTVRHRLMPW